MPRRRTPVSASKSTQRRGPLLAGAAERPDRKTILYGVDPNPRSIRAYWEGQGYEGPRGPLVLRRLRNEADRRPNIIADEAAVFPIEENPEADPTPPLWSFHSVGRDVVRKYAPIIEDSAERHGVDPDLVKAIMYTENARGFWSGLPQAIGEAGSLLPMNINPKIWQRLGVTPDQATDPAANVELGVRLIKRLVERAPGASAEEIHTLYNNLFAEKTNHIGAHSEQAYLQKLWEKEEAPEVGFEERTAASWQQGYEIGGRKLRPLFKMIDRNFGLLEREIDRLLE